MSLRFNGLLLVTAGGTGRIKMSREADQSYFSRRSNQELDAAAAAAGGPAERPHRELAVRYAIRAASIREVYDRLGSED
jgi:hypothetical protein